MPGLNAAFVNVGYEKDAFLHYLDLGPQFQSLASYVDLLIKKGKVPSFEKFKKKADIDKNGKINKVLREGQRILVQITKEPISQKGPRLSSEISIAGRNLVILPFADKVTVSSRMDSAEERNRLKQLIKSIKPANYGVIVRTAAQGKKIAVLDAELRELTQRWEKAINSIPDLVPPQLVLGEISRTSAILRDILSADFNQITVNDEHVLQEVREYIAEIAPEKKKIIKFYNGKTPLFEYSGIDKQIKGLFGRIVPFKNGAYLIIEHTEALHVIDVNSGNISPGGNDQESNAVNVNIAATEEIARQLRLRDMGGIIVIDFIDMQQQDNKQKVFEKMREFMSRDRAKHTILPLSKFGLMQITRQRVRPEMNIKNIEKCPTCKGSGEIIPSILFIDELENKIQNICKNKKKIKHLYMKVHPFIYSHLTKSLFSIRYKWNKKYKCTIHLSANNSFNILQYEIIDEEGNELQA